MSYLSDYLVSDHLAQTVFKMRDLVEHLDFDTIAVRGQSGLLVGAPLSLAMGKNLIIVRKDTDKNHSGLKVEGMGKRQKILILDDFIESGDTVDEIYENIFTYCDQPQFVGIALYAAPKNKLHQRPYYQHPDGTQFRLYVNYLNSIFDSLSSS